MLIRNNRTKRIYSNSFSGTMIYLDYKKIEEILSENAYIFNNLVNNPVTIEDSFLFKETLVISNDIVSINGEKILSTQTNFISFKLNEINYSKSDLAILCKLHTVLCASDDCAIFIARDFDQATIASLMNIPFIFSQNTSINNLKREINKRKNIIESKLKNYENCRNNKKK